LDDATWAAATEHFSDTEMLDPLAGWYHAISYLANATQLAGEPGAPTRASV
jgi:hypothetical protein